MPNEGVATDRLAVVVSPVEDVVTMIIAEDVASWLDRVPLHGVAWSNHAEFAEAIT